MTTDTVRRLADSHPRATKPEFFDKLIDRLGNPSWFLFYLYTPELISATRNVLPDLGIDKDSVSYNGLALMGHGNIGFTPERLKEIYRNSMELDSITQYGGIITTHDIGERPLHHVERSIDKPHSSLILIDHIQWESRGPPHNMPHYDIHFNRYSIYGAVNGRTSKDLFDYLSEVAKTHHVGNRVELRFSF